MELKEMTVEQLEERLSAILAELDNEDADLDALEVEARSIKEELEARKAEEAQKAEIRSAVAAGEGVVVETIKVEERKEMNEMEIRNSNEYINAYAEYIKSNDPTECRALLSENVSGGTVAAPELVYDIIKTAWEKEGIMSRVRKAYMQGNVKIGFEISADGAVAHTEGGAAVNEESLVLGIVNLVPVSIKKWVSVSDEVLDLRGEAFLRYIYDEVAYRIAKKAADLLVANIIACGTVSTTDAPAVPVVKAAVANGTIASALGQLSDEAGEPVAIMNKATWAAFKAASYSGGFAVDPFEGIPVVFNNTLPTYAAASTNGTYAIVGDLGHGALANFPGGEDIDMKYDDTTLMTQDLVRILGRQYVGIGVVAPDAFCKITK